MRPGPHKLVLFFESMCVVVLCHGGKLDAGLPHPGTWQVVSDDSRFVFVMISPLPIEEDIRHPEDAAEIRWIRETYSKSGLYRNNGSNAPIWVYDGPWLSKSIIIAPDGEHLILPGSWTWDEYGLNAVTFMRRGQVIGQYSDRDIISQWVLKAILNGCTPPRCVGSSFSSERMTYSIRTNQGEEFVFDVTSGNMIECYSPFPALYGVALVLVIGLFAVPIVRWRRARQRTIV